MVAIQSTSYATVDFFQRRQPSRLLLCARAGVVSHFVPHLIGIKEADKTAERALNGGISNVATHLLGREQFKGDESPEDAPSNS